MALPARGVDIEAHCPKVLRDTEVCQRTNFDFSTGARV